MLYIYCEQDEDKSHYIYIKHLERLMNLHNHKCDKHQLFCPCCQKGVNGEDVRNHVTECYRLSKDSTLSKLHDHGSTLKLKN